MAPKRTRVVSSSSSSDDEIEARDVLDTHRFVNLSAQHNYLDVWLGKNFVAERGLKPSADDGLIKRQIIEHGWALFVETPMAAPMAIVREFYANARETQNGISYVRGIEVRYNKKAINDLYRMPTFPEDGSDWLAYQSSEIDLDVIISEMCKPDTRWTTKVGTTQKLHFPHTALNRYAKAWYGFICASMLPTRHMNDVTKDRAILLYGILKGKSFDVGALIHSSMLRSMRGSTSGGILHASIVSRLCLAAGVTWDNESLLLPMKDIDHNHIRKYVVWDGGESHPRGLGFLLGNDEEEEDEEAADEAEASTPVPPTVYGHQERDMRRLQRRMDALHADFRSYSMDFSGALTQAFSQLGVQVQFPSFGSTSSYPPPDTPPESVAGDDDADN